MSVLIHKQQSILFSSAEENGAQNKSEDGSRFTVTLQNPIQLPQATVNATIEVEKATIWNVAPNISAAFGNNLFNFTTTNAGNPGTHTITIIDGLYSRANLSSFLSTAFANLSLPSNLIVLSEDSSTQKTILTFLEAGDQVNFTIANSCREVLGFDSRLSPLVPEAAGFSDYSDNTANFNRVNSYLVQCDIVSNGIPINNGGAAVIAQVQIPSGSTGKLINYEPFNPTKVNAQDLIGYGKTNILFKLLDQELRPTPTLGEDWTVLITIRYDVLLTDKEVPLLGI